MPKMHPFRSQLTLLQSEGSEPQDIITWPISATPEMSKATAAAKVPIE